MKRNTLKFFAAGALLAAAATVYAGGKAEKAKPAAEAKIAEHASADIVVVGAGGSGLSAALTAAEAGAKVIVLEKMKAAGGTLNFSEGIMAAESDIQKEKGITATKRDIYKLIMEYSHYRANPLLVSALVNETPKTINWLQDNKVVIQDVVAFGPGFPSTWHLWKDHKGANTIAVLLDRLKEKGVEIRYETPGQKLIMKDGKVAGVVAKAKNGDLIQIDCRAAVVGTGGFANNAEMMAEYTEFTAAIPVGNVGKTGDGIRMAWEAGAAERGVKVVQAFVPLVANMTSMSTHLYKATRQFNVPIVNTKGKRFMDESMIINWAYEAQALGTQGGVAYVVLDTGLIKYFMEHGVPGTALNPEPILLTKLPQDLEQGIEKKGVFKADTIEELAGLVGMKAETLSKTIADYNAACDSGVDTDAFKPASSLNVKIAEAPFYAVKIVSSSIGTLGGVEINEKAEAVNDKGEPIPGLYTVGNDAGGMYGDAYDLLASGGTVAFAINSGRIAGRNAAEFVKK